MAKSLDAALRYWVGHLEMGSDRIAAVADKRRRSATVDQHRTTDRTKRQLEQIGKPVNAPQDASGRTVIEGWVVL